MTTKAHKKSYMGLSIMETLNALKNKDVEVRKMILRNNDCPALRDILIGGYSKNVSWAIPPGTPPVEEDEIASTPTMKLENVPQHFPYWIKGCEESRIERSQMSQRDKFENLRYLQTKREARFLEVYKALSKEEREILVQIVNKDLNVRGLSKKIVVDIGWLNE